MTRDDIAISVTVDASPMEAFDAIADVRGWWTGRIEGPTAAVGDRFTYRYAAMHRSTQVVTEAVPGRRIVWHVEESDLAFTDTRNDWDGTDVEFDVTEEAPGRTRVDFVHRGITPAVECFDQCSPAWGHYVGTNLRERIESGRPALTPA